MPVVLPDWAPRAPLQPLPLDWAQAAGVELAVLRLDLLDPLISGNKWFKLSQHLAAAQACDAAGVISLGGAHSNHLHALAAAGKRFAFNTVGLLRGHPQQTPTISDLQAFGMQLIIAEQPGAVSCRPGRVSFTDALAQADVISLHCPLTTATTKLFNAEVFAAVKPNALLINTARGGLIDEAALLDALQNGTLGGAALDVVTQEPPAPDNILIRANLPNLLITPHMAWASAEARQRMVLQLADNIQAFIQGSPRHQV